MLFISIFVSVGWYDFQVINFKSCANRTSNMSCIEHLRSLKYFYTDDIVKYDFINLELAQVGYNKIHLVQPVFVSKGSMIQFSRRGTMSNTHLASDPNDELYEDFKYRCKVKRAKFPTELLRSRCRIEKLYAKAKWRFFLRLLVKELVPASYMPELVPLPAKAEQAALNQQPRLETSSTQPVTTAKPGKMLIYSHSTRHPSREQQQFGANKNKRINLTRILNLNFR